MTQKTIIISSIVLLTIFVSTGIYSYNKNKKTLAGNIPLISPKKTTTKTPVIQKKVELISNSQTNNLKVINKIPSETSIVEIEKIVDSLPIRLNDYATNTGLKTTINIYKSAVDEDSILRLEIYGINYNEQSLTGQNALAFKESFLEAKKYLPKTINLKNTQIIYGNRQYIQDTATYWVNNFKLLD